jgi:hypothetical protein
MSNRDVGSLSLGWADKDENVSGRSLRVDGRFFEAQQDRNQLARADRSQVARTAKCRNANHLPRTRSVDGGPRDRLDQSGRTGTNRSLFHLID